MVYVPKQLTFSLQKLEGMSSQIVKILPLNKTSFQSSEQMTLRLPANTVIDLHSLSLQFKASTSSTAEVPAVGFPRHTSSLIQRLEVLAGGQSLSGGGLQEYNTLYNVIGNLEFGPDKLAEQAIYANGGDQGAVVGEKTDVDMTVDGFLGLLGGYAGQRYLHTGLLSNNAEIRLTWANPSVLTTGGTAQAGANFTVKDVSLLATCVSWQDGWYDSAIASLLEDGPIQIPFKNYTSYAYASSAATGTMSFSHESSSVDCLYALLRSSTYDQAGASGSLVAGTSKFFNFTSDDATYQWRINTTTAPQFLASVKEVYAITKASINAGGISSYANSITSADQYADNKFTFALALNYLSDEKNTPILSGFDTRGNQVPFTLTYNGSTANLRSFVIVETTSGH